MFRGSSMVVLAVVLGGSAQGQTSAIPATKTPPAMAARPGMLNQFMTGDWVGTLAYRDYSAPAGSTARTQLPTRLTLTPAADGREITFNYTYDDGPGKTVRETSRLTLFPTAGRATVASDKVSTSYAVSGFEAFGKGNQGVLVMTGAGTENDKPAEFRLTLTLGPDSLTLVKESRSGGGEFGFRDGYTFMRVGVAGS